MASQHLLLHEELGSILIFIRILTLEEVNENHLIKNNNFQLALLQLALY